MAAKRRRKACRGQVEDDLPANARWSGLRQQQELETRNLSERENGAARRRTRELLEGDWTNIRWI